MGPMNYTIQMIKYCDERERERVRKWGHWGRGQMCCICASLSVFQMKICGMRPILKGLSMMNVEGLLV